MLTKAEFICVMQSWIFSIITPVFNATSFKNHFNMLNCCSRAISYYYYQCWKHLGCIIDALVVGCRSPLLSWELHWGGASLLSSSAPWTATHSTLHKEFSTRNSVTQNCDTTAAPQSRVRRDFLYRISALALRAEQNDRKLNCRAAGLQGCRLTSPEDWHNYTKSITHLFNK